MPLPPTRWETQRLILRPPEAGDAGPIFHGYARDPDVTRYLPWRPHRTIADTHAFLERCHTVWGNGSACPWVLQLRDGGQIAGMLELRVAPPRADFGYVLARAWWGRGLMTEALRPVVAWAIAQPEIYRVWAVCDIDNAASVRVLERAGLQHEGVLRRWIQHPNTGDVPRDAHCYSLVR